MRASQSRGGTDFDFPRGALGVPACFTRPRAPCQQPYEWRARRVGRGKPYDARIQRVGRGNAYSAGINLFLLVN